MLKADSMFRNRRFRTLWVARLVSNLGNGMSPTALSFGILALPGATARDLGLVLAAQAIPLVVLLPLGGVIADRLPRAVVISTTDMILGGFVVTSGALFVTGHATVTNIALINVVSGVLHALWWPAFPGLVPAVLGDRDLQRGNALIAVASNAGLISGAGVAGALIATLGPGTAIIIDGVTFLVAGALVFSFRDVAKAQPSGESMLFDLNHGWKTFISFRWLWVVVAVFGIIMGCIRAAFDVGGPVLMRQSFDGPTSWALIQTAQAIGFLTGALLAARIRPQRPLVYCLVVSVVIPAYMLAMSVPFPVPALAGFAFLLGVGFDQWGVRWGPAMQTHIPREALSRASAFDAMGSLLFGPVGLAVAGPVIAAFGLRPLFIGAAALTTVLLVLPLFEREVRDLRWIDVEAEAAL
ncbi:MAG: MFS transporter [Candidatus Nanopelagicales bacterium]